MKKKQFIRILEEFGYVLVRSNSHYIYSNGTKMIPVKMGRHCNTMIMRRTLKEIGYLEWQNVR